MSLKLSAICAVLTDSLYTFLLNFLQEFSVWGRKCISNWKRNKQTNKNKNIYIYKKQDSHSCPQRLFPGHVQEWRLDRTESLLDRDLSPLLEYIHPGTWLLSNYPTVSKIITCYLWEKMNRLYTRLLVSKRFECPIGSEGALAPMLSRTRSFLWSIFKIFDPPPCMNLLSLLRRPL